MEYLIVSTLPPQHGGAAELIGQLAETLPQAEVVYTQQMKIGARLVLLFPPEKTHRKHRAHHCYTGKQCQREPHTAQRQAQCGGF